MIRIFIVEDEVFALRALEQKIKDIGGPYTVVGTAFNGRQALDLIEETNPSVILTDIQMPDMDGIAMLKELRRRGVSALSVIITGYQEFEYAKQALLLGATDYLLKPVSPLDLETCLKGCEAVLRKRLHAQNAISFFIGEDSVSLDGISFAHGCIVNYFVMGNTMESFNSMFHPNIPYLSPAEIESVLPKFLPKEVTFFVLDGMRTNEKAIILTCNETQSISWPTYLLPFGERISQVYGTFVTQFYTFCEDAQGIGGAIQSCRKNAAMSILLGKSQVLSLLSPLHLEPLKLADSVEILALLLKRKETASLKTNIQTMLGQWGLQNYPATVIKNNLTLLLNELYFTLSPTPEGVFDSEFHIENIICFADDMGGLAENFTQLLTELFTKPIITEKNDTAETLVQQTEAYFAQNLSNNITLQTLVEELNVSRAYLCRVFKSAKDTSPMDYYSQLKVTRAKEMILAMPGVPLHEIADTLGYSDTYYFSKVFKKIAGFPPSKLREGEIDKGEH